MIETKETHEARINESNKWELKTLKDIDFKKEDYEKDMFLGAKIEAYDKMLKAEAVKWIKACPCCKVSKLVYIYDNDKLVRKEMQKEFCFACLRYKHFFNLTEEDLK